MPSHERMSELVHLAKTKQSTLAFRLLDLFHVMGADVVPRQCVLQSQG